MNKEIVKIENNNALELHRIEIDSQIATAKQYPRDISEIIKMVTELSTMDKETAESCFYSKPVGNGDYANGLSIRFAEIVFSMWGNLRIRTSISGITKTQVIAVSEIHDIEKNIAGSYEVRKSIIGKHGRYSETMIAVTCDAAQAIARRNAILNIVPKGFFTAAIEKIKNASLGKNKEFSKNTILEYAKKYISYFKKMRVTENEVLSTLGLTDITQITKEHLTTLKGFDNALKDKVETIDSIFRATEPQEEEIKPLSEKKLKDAIAALENYNLSIDAFYNSITGKYTITQGQKTEIDKAGKITPDKILEIIEMVKSGIKTIDQIQLVLDKEDFAAVEAAIYSV